MKTVTNLQDIGFTSKSRLLVVVPHADDESVFAAGFISQVCDIAQECDVICMTDGSATTLQYGVEEQDSLVDVRYKELEQACRIMSVTTMVCANIPDGYLQEYQKAGMEFLQKEYERFAPTDVLTLEPAGIYGHPDHTHLTRWLITLTQDTALAKHRLWFTTVPEGFSTTEIRKKMQLPQDPKPSTPEIQFKLSLYNQYLKQQACLAHYSQLGENPEFWKRWANYGLLENEYFLQYQP